MEGRDQAKRLFSKSITNAENLEPEQQKNVWKSVVKLLRDALSKLPKTQRFQFREFWLIILKTAEKGHLVPEKAAEAFENLEKYFVLLYRAPWKKEFRKLKTYGGHFQSKVKAHLENPESIICLVGFEPEGSGTLSLKGEVDPNLLLSVAFECVVASVECEMISEYHRKMKEGGSLVIDVVRWRDTGEMPEVRPSSIRDPVKSLAQDSAYASASNVKPSVLGAEGGYGKNLPYIDEDENVVPNDTGYVEGTIDEHYMASLQRLSQNDASSDRQTSAKSSDEWSYVTKTLTNKYGQGYFEGPRGDVIRNNPNIRMRHDDMSDEGIDVEEEPPRVNIEHPPVRVDLTAQRSISSRDRTRDSGYRDSGYRTAPSSQVHYPPGDLSNPYLAQPQSNSAYLSNSSGRSQPLMARGLPERHETGYPNVDRLSRKQNIYGSYNRSSQSARTTADLMSRNMQSLGLGLEWSCPFCTSRNPRDSVVCFRCGKSRDQGPDVDGPQCGDSIRVCKKCTLENEPGARICSACDNPLDNVHTFV